MHKPVGHWLCCSLLGMSLCLLGSCADKDGTGKRRGFFEQREKPAQKATPKDRKSLEHLPKLNELAQGDDPKQTPLADSGVVAAGLLTRVWLPADQTINNLWREVSTNSLSDMELLAWHRNQLRAALVSKEKLNRLLKGLPGHFGVQQQVMTFSGDLISLDPANVRASHRPVSLEIAGRSRMYSGGKMQLLVSATTQAALDPKISSEPILKLTILPHMYVPKVTLLPRDHMESALDGQIFSELMLRVLMSSDQVLLIAPDVPLPVYDDTRPTAQEKAADTQATAASVDTLTKPPAAGEQATKEKGGVDEQADPPTPSPVNQPLVLPELSTAPQVKPVPYGLGQAVLTGRQMRRELFQLWILEIRPIELNKPAVE